MRIDRCNCFQVTFAQLKAAAVRHDARSIEELQAYIDFGRQCKLCHPYVRRMLRTGETVFREVLDERGGSMGEARE